MKFKNSLILFIGGALYALAFPVNKTLALFPMIFIACAIFLNTYWIKEKKLKTKLFENLVFLWGFNTVGFYWLNFTLSEFGGLPIPVNVIAWQFFSLIIGLHMLLFTVFEHFILNRYNTYLKIFLITLSYPFFEYLIPQQFPAHFGHPWLIVAPYLKLAQVFGVPVYSFLSLMIGSVLLIIVRTKKVPTKNVAISIILLLINFTNPIELHPGSETLNVKIIQANIGNDLKLKSESGIQLAVDQVISSYVNMTLQDDMDELKLQDIDLVIWPETSYPRVLSTQFNSNLSRELREITQSINTNLLIGTYDLAHNKFTSFEQQYNAAVLFKDQDIAAIYHKRVLIPFGEGLPFGPLNESLAPYAGNVSFFAKGSKYTKFSVKNFNFITLICYEVLFPRYVKEYLNNQSNINLIVNLTNDSWYGPYIEQEQHLFLAKWRSLEFNIPMIRATNTGISTVILPNGDEIKRTNNFEQTSLYVSIPHFEASQTIFLEYGLLSYIGLTILLLIVSILGRKTFFQKIMHS